MIFFQQLFNIVFNFLINRNKPSLYRRSLREISIIYLSNIWNFTNITTRGCWFVSQSLFFTAYKVSVNLWINWPWVCFLKRTPLVVIKNINYTRLGENIRILCNLWPSDEYFRKCDATDGIRHNLFQQLQSVIENKQFIHNISRLLELDSMNKSVCGGSLSLRNCFANVVIFNQDV